MAPTISPHEGLTLGATITDIDLSNLEDAALLPGSGFQGIGRMPRPG